MWSRLNWTNLEGHSPELELLVGNLNRDLKLLLTPRPRAANSSLTRIPVAAPARHGNRILSTC